MSGGCSGLHGHGALTTPHRDGPRQCTLHSVVRSCHPRYSDVLERNNFGLLTFRFVYHIYFAVDIYCDTVDMGIN